MLPASLTSRQGVLLPGKSNPLRIVVAFMPEDGWDDVQKTAIKYGWAIQIIDFMGLYLSVL
jgi:hypothetical protein